MTHWKLVIPCLLLMAGGLSAQVSRDIQAEYNRRIRAADADSSTANERVLAAEAARFLRRFDEAAEEYEFTLGATTAARARAWASCPAMNE